MGLRESLSRDLSVAAKLVSSSPSSLSVDKLLSLSLSLILLLLLLLLVLLSLTLSLSLSLLSRVNFASCSAYSKLGTPHFNECL